MRCVVCACMHACVRDYACVSGFLFFFSFFFSFFFFFIKAYAVGTFELHRQVDTIQMGTYNIAVIKRLRNRAYRGSCGYKVEYNVVVIYLFVYLFCMALCSEVNLQSCAWFNAKLCVVTTYYASNILFYLFVKKKKNGNFPFFQQQKWLENM